MITQVTITFNGLPVVDDYIRVKAVVLPATEFQRGETFKALRAYPGQAQVKVAIAEQAATYAAAFVADYPGFDVEVAGNVVTLKIAAGSTFSHFSGCDISGDFAVYSELNQKDNVVHVIRFTPRRYDGLSTGSRGYLVAEDGRPVLTEDGESIKI